MADSLQERIIEVVQGALNSDLPPGTEPVVIRENDSMETVARWDSLNFMKVFLAINETFGIDPDFDDAIHYISISALRAYLHDKVS